MCWQRLGKHNLPRMLVSQLAGLISEAWTECRMRHDAQHGKLQKETPLPRGRIELDVLDLALHSPAPRPSSCCPACKRLPPHPPFAPHQKPSQAYAALLGPHKSWKMQDWMRGGGWSGYGIPGSSPSLSKARHSLLSPPPSTYHLALPCSGGPVCQRSPAILLPDA